MGAAESNRRNTKTCVSVNEEEHLPGDTQKFELPGAWLGRMKRKMQLKQLKQINATRTKEGTRTAV